MLHIGKFFPEGFEYLLLRMWWMEEETIDVIINVEAHEHNKTWYLVLPSHPLLGLG